MNRPQIKSLKRSVPFLDKWTDREAYRRAVCNQRVYHRKITRKDDMKVLNKEIKIKKLFLERERQILDRYCGL